VNERPSAYIPLPRATVSCRAMLSGGAGLRQPQQPNPCRACGHGAFIHRDVGGQGCLFNGCSCDDFNGRRLETARRPSVLPLTVPIMAMKGSSTITGSLSPHDASARAEELSQAGWSVYIGRHATSTEEA
jgi:hypothetical protein